MALGTLHALPSPVPRRNQKPFKPAFFDSLRRQHEAEDGVRDVQAWLQQVRHLVLQRNETSADVGPSQNSAVALPGWSQREVVLSAGTALRAIDRAGLPSERAPPTHRLFSTLEFARDSGAGAELAEEGDVGLDAPEPEREVRARPLKTPADDDEVTGRWLSDDDIEEW